MEIKIDEKEFAQAFADLAYKNISYQISEERKDSLFYYDDIAKALRENIKKLINENKEWLLDVIATKCAEMYHKDIKLQAMLSVMVGKLD